MHSESFAGTEERALTVAGYFSASWHALAYVSLLTLYAAYCI